MKSIDREIFEVEQRLSQREAAIKVAARETRQRTVRALKSPAAIGGALLLGFLVAGRIARGPGKGRATPDIKEQPKRFALGTLLMTGTTWVIRSQFGGPAGLAQYVLSKVRQRPAKGAPPAHPQP